MDFAATANVLVGSCSNPVYAPAGRVNITEGGPSAFRDGVATMPSDRFSTRISLPARPRSPLSRCVRRGVGQVDRDVHEQLGSLKICKIAGDATLVGQWSSFTANGTPYSVTAGAGAGHCVLAGRYRAGTSITVVETPSAGQAVGSISLLPSGRTFTPGGSDFLGQSATLTLGPGETVVTYTNVLASPGLLKICKAGAGTGPRPSRSGPARYGTEHHAGHRHRDGAGRRMRTRALVVPVRRDPDDHGDPDGGLSVGSITVADADRLVAGSVNLAGGSVGAYIGSGVTVATFTNVAGGGVVTPTSGERRSPCRRLHDLECDGHGRCGARRPRVPARPPSLLRRLSRPRRGPRSPRCRSSPRSPAVTSWSASAARRRRPGSR